MGRICQKGFPYNDIYLLPSQVTNQMDEKCLYAYPLCVCCRERLLDFQIPCDPSLKSGRGRGMKEDEGGHLLWICLSFEKKKKKERKEKENKSVAEQRETEEKMLRWHEVNLTLRETGCTKTEWFLNCVLGIISVWGGEEWCVTREKQWSGKRADRFREEQTQQEEDTQWAESHKRRK